MGFGFNFLFNNLKLNRFDLFSSVVVGDLFRMASAEDIAADVFSAAVQDDTTREDDLNYDLGCLAAFDSHPLDTKELASRGEDYLTEVARDDVQLLFNRLYQLPTSTTQDGAMLRLPKSWTDLPREKPAPMPKPLTRWEKFAKERGIAARKQGRMEFDEATQEWAPRWGYGSARSKEQWIVELPDDADGSVDHIAKQRLLKKRRVVQNEISQMKNIERAAKAMNKATSHAVSVLGDRSKSKATMGFGAKGTAARLQNTRVSTASIGKFDRIVPGEPARPKVTQQRKFKPNERNSKGDKAHAMSLVDRVLAGPGVRVVKAKKAGHIKRNLGKGQHKVRAAALQMGKNGGRRKK